MEEKSTGLAIVVPSSIQELKELSSMLAPGIAIPEAFRGKAGDCAACIMTGAELGLLPMQSFRALEVIKGKVTLKAEAQVALVRKRRDVCKFFRLVESTDKVATYETQRVEDPGPTRVSFTMAQAQAAGLTGNPTWAKFPDAMLRARASSALCRIVYSDVLLGIFDPDEAEQADAPWQRAPKATETVVKAAEAPSVRATKKATQAPKAEPIAPQTPATETVEAEFTVAAPGAQPEAQPDDTQVAVDVKSDPALAAIDSAASVEDLRNASLRIGKIDDPERKAVVSAAYNAKMATLRGGK